MQFAVFNIQPMEDGLPDEGAVEAAHNHLFLRSVQETPGKLG